MSQCLKDISCHFPVTEKENICIINLSISLHAYDITVHFLWLQATIQYPPKPVVYKCCKLIHGPGRNRSYLSAKVGVVEVNSTNKL